MSKAANVALGGLLSIGVLAYGGFYFAAWADCPTRPDLKAGIVFVAEGTRGQRITVVRAHDAEHTIKTSYTIPNFHPDEKRFVSLHYMGFTELDYWREGDTLAEPVVDAKEHLPLLSGKVGTSVSFPHEYVSDGDKIRSEITITLEKIETERLGTCAYEAWQMRRVWKTSTNGGPWEESWGLSVYFPELMYHDPFAAIGAFDDVTVRRFQDGDIWPEDPPKGVKLPP